ncbi:MAG: hypothetical protein JNL01_16690 [Bdellovibrionales bacterium]|nr:hypothetical protein [Bdellovibrionales bacterium]
MKPVSNLALIGPLVCGLFVSNLATAGFPNPFQLSLETATASFPVGSQSKLNLGFKVNSQSNSLLDMIDATKSTLDIEIYEMSSVTVRNAVYAAQKRGVSVRIIYEPKPVGSSCDIVGGVSGAVQSKDPNCMATVSFLKQVEKNGGQTVPFNKKLCGTATTSCFQHGKIVISDKKVALVSTGNFNSSNLCLSLEKPSKCNRDYSVVVDDSEILAGLQSFFDQDFAAAPFDPKSLLTPKLAQKMTVSPISKQALIDMIQSAKTSVEVQNQYLRDPDLNQALIDVATRGVKVQLMVVSACNFGKPTAKDTQQFNSIYGAFAQAGIDARFFTKKIQVNGYPGYMHAKAIVVDGKYGWVGSINGSTTSLDSNREYGVFFDEATWVQSLQGQMASDFTHQMSANLQESLTCVKD